MNISEFNNNRRHNVHILLLRWFCNVFGGYLKLVFDCKEDAAKFKANIEGFLPEGFKVLEI